MLVNYELKSTKLKKEGYLAKVFLGVFFLILAFLFSFLSVFIMLPFLLLSGVFIFWEHLFGKVAECEMIKIEDDILSICNNSKVILSVNIQDIEAFDIDTYSPYKYIVAQSAVAILYFRKGESFSISYMSYEYTDLANLKKIIFYNR